MGHGIWTLPNLLTLSRFPASPLMLWLLLCSTASGPWSLPVTIALVVVSVLVFLSDFFDGRVARARGLVSDFGKIMDPIADATFFMSLMFGLAANPRFAMPIWFPVLMVYREVGIHVIRRYAALRGVVVPAKLAGKAKMAIQCIAFSGLGAALLATDTGLHAIEEATLRAITWWVGLVVAVVNVASLLEYAREAPALMAPCPESAPATVAGAPEPSMPAAAPVATSTPESPESPESPTGPAGPTGKPA